MNDDGPCNAPLRWLICFHEDSFALVRLESFCFISCHVHSIHPPNNAPRGFFLYGSFSVWVLHSFQTNSLMVSFAVVEMFEELGTAGLLPLKQVLFFSIYRQSNSLVRLSFSRLSNPLRRGRRRVSRPYWRRCLVVLSQGSV